MLKRGMLSAALLIVLAAARGNAQGGVQTKWVDFQDWGPVEFCGFSCDRGDLCCFLVITT